MVIVIADMIRDNELVVIHLLRIVSLERGSWLLLRQRRNPRDERTGVIDGHLLQRAVRVVHVAL